MANRKRSTDRLPAIVPRKQAEVRDRKFFASRIMGAYGKSVEGFLEMGRHLARAKAELDHGEFGKLIERDLPFAESSARKLMAISGNPVISNRSQWNALPSNWTTLYELTKLPEPELEAALSDGRIRPEMKRADVVAMRGQPSKPPLPPRTEQTQEAEPHCPTCTCTSAENPPPT